MGSWPSAPWDGRKEGSRWQAVWCPGASSEALLPGPFVLAPDPLRFPDLPAVSLTSLPGHVGKVYS